MFKNEEATKVRISLNEREYEDRICHFCKATINRWHGHVVVTTQDTQFVIHQECIGRGSNSDFIT